MCYRIMQAAGVMSYSQTAVYRRNHLRQSAWFKTRRHKNKVRGSICQACQVFIEVTDSDAVMETMIVNNVFKMLLKFSVCHKNNLKVLAPV